jgi:hypothetical protein
MASGHVNRANRPNTWLLRPSLPTCRYPLPTRSRPHMTHLRHRSSKFFALREFYSITSSATASKVEGTVRPSALAVLRFIAILNLTGSWTGNSAGFSPRRMRST